MGWEMRAGKRCYYRKVREGSRVRSVYCGSGERAEQAAREDEARRCATPEVTNIQDGKKRGYGFPRHKKGAESREWRERKALERVKLSIAQRSKTQHPAGFTAHKKSPGIMEDPFWTQQDAAPEKDVENATKKSSVELWADEIPVEDLYDQYIALLNRSTGAYAGGFFSHGVDERLRAIERRAVELTKDWKVVCASNQAIDFRTRLLCLSHDARTKNNPPV